MKFTSIVAAALFGITAYASALPASVDERASNPVNIIKNDVTTLTNTVNADLKSITTTINTIGGSVSGQLQVIAALNIDLNAIVNAIYTAMQGIASSTAGTVTALNPIDFNTLIVTIQALIQLVVNIGVTLKSGLSELPADTQTALSGEIGALQAALTNLLTPLTTYVGQVVTAISNTGINVTGIQSLLSSLVSIVTNLVLNIGVNSTSSS